MDIVFLYFICPNIVSYHAELDDDGTYLTPDYWKFGFLVGDDFDFRTHRTNDTKGSEHYVTQVLKLLGDERKFEILSYIRDKEAYGSELTKHLNLTIATVSHHMNALFTAGLVEVKRIDTRIYYTANHHNSTRKMNAKIRGKWLTFAPLSQLFYSQITCNY